MRIQVDSDPDPKQWLYVASFSQSMTVVFPIIKFFIFHVSVTAQWGGA
jgi:hypothetical protein